ncbi:mechanosensitive ion channel [[Clostridium] spiroforme]|nr:mechanosensitive ion channel [Thomasclavelia spiroformis]
MGLENLEILYNQIDKLFVNGVISGMISIITMAIIVLIANKFANKFIKKKWPENNIIQRKIKRVILVGLFIAVVFSEVKYLRSFAGALLASGGIVAVVIGLASQQAASNLINGAMILAYKPYKVGDYIVLKSKNVSGTVIDISLRHSIIETIEKTQMIVPNEVMNQEIIENITQIENVKANYLYIDISYESDVDKAMSLMQQAAIRHPLFVDGRTDMTKEAVPVIVYALKDSGISLRATITSENHAQGFQMLSDIRKELLTEFKNNGIEIPYPHVQIVKNEE